MPEQKTVVSALNNYFNVGEGKRSTTDFLNELKALSTEEKQELAEGACAIMGWELKK